MRARGGAVGAHSTKLRKRTATVSGRDAPHALALHRIELLNLVRIDVDLKPGFSVDVERHAEEQFKQAMLRQ